MPDAESPFRIGHFPYPYYPRTRILLGDITNYCCPVKLKRA